ncbi:TIGR04211 family SH3 domain-containing protein [Haliea sp. E1-2-M8]|uniref:TIGR04211 family SH3 domain-containing protein n=1 Tax=Haliea sp. E1-2-M8 TaxID=3064706 RepID=UPI0027238FBC|nr:TIGR04211 family SH3 domain-containing protein [Haliea sp. E1-2-M8]MDO8862244.1 TIGR04211 family SH3 domain-containing protein [Haliea sp. E1-2-M8]
MQLTLIISLLALLLTAPVQAQEVRYISDTQYVPVRSGAGNEFRIVHRGIPSGTRLTVGQTSADGEWSEVTTENGTSGWVRTQHLMAELPARNQVAAAAARAEQLAAENAELSRELAALKAERAELEGDVNTADSSLQALTEELTQLKQISGRSLQLDADNRRLVVEAETLRAEADMLGAENQRLQDNLRSSAFLDGALAVLLGVVIALVAPRLWPKRRRNDGWG